MAEAWIFLPSMRLFDSTRLTKLLDLSGQFFELYSRPLRDAFSQVEKLQRERSD